MDYSKITELFDPDFHLENDYVLLRHLVKSDKEGFGKIAFNDQIWKFFTSTIRNENELDVFINEAIHNRKNQIRCAFTVIDKSTGKIAGSTSFGNISDLDKRIEIGWTWLAPQFQQTGLNRNNKFLLMEYVFEQIGYVRVEFKTDILNLPARKALKGIGAIEEGVLRSHTLMPFGRRRDTIYYSILKNEWPSIKSSIFYGYEKPLK